MELAAIPQAHWIWRRSPSTSTNCSPTGTALRATILGPSSPAFIQYSAQQSAPLLENSWLWACLRLDRVISVTLIQYFLKLKKCVKLLMETHLRTTGCGIAMGSRNVTYLPPEWPRTQANAPRLNPSRWRLVLDLPTPEGWKAELT